MKKGLFRNIIFLGIIILFIGVGIHPAFAINTKPSIINKYIKDDCNCNEATNDNLVKAERLLNTVEIYFKLSMVLSSNNPKLIEINEELSDKISVFSRINNIESTGIFRDWPIICSILKSVWQLIGRGWAFFDDVLSEDSKLRLLIMLIIDIVFIPMQTLLWVFNCY